MFIWYFVFNAICLFINQKSKMSARETDKQFYAISKHNLHCSMFVAKLLFRVWANTAVIVFMSVWALIFKIEFLGQQWSVAVYLFFLCVYICECLFFCVYLFGIHQIPAQLPPMHQWTCFLKRNDWSIFKSNI